MSNFMLVYLYFTNRAKKLGHTADWTHVPNTSTAKIAWDFFFCQPVKEKLHKYSTFKAKNFMKS